MFRSPWELEAHVRHRNESLASERQRCDLIDRAAAASPRLLTQWRRRFGIGLIQVGAAIAGGDALRRISTPPTWPDLANR